MALVHGPSKQPLPTRPSGRSLTFRLQNIPAHIDGGEVKAALAEGNVTNISQYSFARVDYEVACATVTFRSTPAAFQHAADGSYHTVPLQLSISRQELLLTVDTKFEGLTTLYHPEGQATVDIVAVNGLGGHSIGSWQAPSGNDVWLRDFLPRDVPSARIMTYGYASNVKDNDSKSSIGDLASDFLENLKASREGYKALVIASKNIDKPSHFAGLQENADLFKACYALVFFGVPNLGLRHEQLSTIVGGQANEELIRSLVVSRDSEPSQYLDRLHKDFQQAFTFEDSPLVLLFETKPTKTVEQVAPGVWKQEGPPCLMVTAPSATNVGNTPQPWNQIPIEADHRSMVKFAHKLDPNYIKVKARLKSLVVDAVSVIAKRFSPTPEIKKLLKPFHLRSSEESRFYSQRSITFDRHSTAGQYADWFLQSEPYRRWRTNTPSSPSKRILWYAGRPDAAFSEVISLAGGDILEEVGNGENMARMVINLFCAGMDQDNKPARKCAFQDVFLKIVSQIVEQDGALLESLDLVRQRNVLLLCQTEDVSPSAPQYPGNEFPLFAHEVLGDLIEATSRTKIWLCIDNFHLIQPEHHRIRFLDKLKQLATRSRSPQRKDLRILLTTLPFAPIASALKEFPMVDSAFEAHDCLLSLAEHSQNDIQKDVTAIQDGSFDWIFANDLYKEWETSDRSSILWFTGKVGVGKSALLKTLLKKRLDISSQQNSVDGLSSGLQDVLSMQSKCADPAAENEEHKQIVAAFFFGQGDEFDNDSHIHMLICILFQILSQDKRLYSAYRPYWATIHSRDQLSTSPDPLGATNSHTSVWSSASLLAVLRMLSGTTPLRYRFYIYIDALNLAPRDTVQETLLKTFQEICEDPKGENQYKIILTSRSRTQTPGSSDMEQEINLEQENHRTIDILVQRGIAPIQAAVMTLSDEEKEYFDVEEVKNTLLRGANGMVLWVSLVLKQLETQLRSGMITPSSMISELDKLQGSMQSFYQAAVAQLSKTSDSDASSMTTKWLSWVSCAQRLLTLEEFRDATLMSSLEESFDGPLEDLRKRRMIISNHSVVRNRLSTVGGGLLELHTADLPLPASVKPATSLSAQVVVQLSHHTVKKFLASTAAEPYTIGDSTGHGEVLSACIRYLEVMLTPKRLFVGFKRYADSQEEVQIQTRSDFEALSQNLDVQPLLHYIFSFFGHHLQAIHEDHNLNLALQPLSLLLEKVFQDTDSAVFHLLASWSVLITGAPLDTKRSHEDRHNLAERARRWRLYVLKDHHDITEWEKVATTHFVTRLFIAGTRVGHSRTAQLMQLLGISPDVYDDLYGCYALEAAAASLSPSEVLQNFNKRSTQGQTPRGLPSLPPPMPSSKNHMMLLEGPTQPSHNQEVALLQQAFTSSPLNRSLLAAAHAGNLENLKVLLSCGAAPDTRGFERESCLHIAALQNAPDIIQLIIDAGADINAADVEGRTPLHLNASRGHLAGTEKLLKLGAIVTLHDRYRQTPVQVARRNKHEAVEALLLEHGAIRPEDEMVFHHPRGPPAQAFVPTGREHVLPPRFDPSLVPSYGPRPVPPGFPPNINHSQGAQRIAPAFPTTYNNQSFGPGPAPLIDSNYTGARQFFPSDVRPYAHSGRHRRDWSDSSSTISTPSESDRAGSDISMPRRRGVRRRSYERERGEEPLILVEGQPHPPPGQRSTGRQYDLNDSLHERVAVPLRKETDNDKRKLFAVPHTSYTQLIGRERELRTLYHHLDQFTYKWEARQEEVSFPRIIIVHGLVGVGKTELVNRFVRAAGGYVSLSNVFWVNACTSSSVRESYGDIANEYVPEYSGTSCGQSPIQAFNSWLDKANLSCWLLVVDGLDDPRLCMKDSPDYVPTPTNTNGMVVITTRNPYLHDSLFAALVIHLRPLGRGDISLIASEMDEKDDINSSSSCYGLPLSLKIRSTRANNAHSPTVLISKPQPAESIRQSDLLHSEITLQMIEPTKIVIEQFRKHCAVGADVVSILSCMASGLCSPHLLTHCNRWEGPPAWEQLQKLDFVRTKNNLKGFGMSLHPLVRLAERRRLLETSTSTKWQLRACDWLQSLVPHAHSSGGIPFETRQFLMDSVENIFAEQDPQEMSSFMEMKQPLSVLTSQECIDASSTSAAFLLHERAWWYFSQDCCSQAYGFVERAKAVRRHILGPENIETRRSGFLCALIMRKHSRSTSWYLEEDALETLSATAEKAIIDAMNELDTLDPMVTAENDRDHYITRLENKLRQAPGTFMANDGATIYQVPSPEEELRILKDEENAAYSQLHPQWRQLLDAGTLQGLTDEIDIVRHFKDGGTLHSGHMDYTYDMDDLRDLTEELPHAECAALEMLYCFNGIYGSDLGDPKRLRLLERKLTDAGVCAVASFSSSLREVVTTLQPLTPYERRRLKSENTWTPIRFSRKLAKQLERTYPLYDSDQALTLWSPPLTQDRTKMPLLLTEGPAIDSEEEEEEEQDIEEGAPEITGPDEFLRTPPTSPSTLQPTETGTRKTSPSNLHPPPRSSSPHSSRRRRNQEGSSADDRSKHRRHRSSGDRHQRTGSSSTISKGKTADAVRRQGGPTNDERANRPKKTSRSTYTDDDELTRRPRRSPKRSEHGEEYGGGMAKSSRSKEGDRSRDTGRKKGGFLRGLF